MPRIHFRPLHSSSTKEDALSQKLGNKHLMTSAITPKRDRILGALWGSLVGDALGVPVEFKDRATRQLDPVTDMRSYGTHRQPAGTWSDDSSLILCSVWYSDCGRLEAGSVWY